MKKIGFFTIIALTLFLSSCRSTKTIDKSPDIISVKFLEGKAFEEVLNQSKTSKKVVFVDFYTQGCLPCKVMDETVFTEKIVFDFYNKNFINVKADGLSFDYFEIARQYEVKEYPTLVFLDEAGTVLHSETGAVSANKLLEIGKKVMAGRVL